MANRWHPDDPNQDIRIPKKKFPALRQLAIENAEKYGKPPSWEMIEAFITKTQMDYHTFERFFDIPFNTITQIKNGGTPFRRYHPILPPRVWGFVYEGVIPKYGVKYVLVKKSDLPKVEKIKPKKVYKKREAKIIELENDIHGRVNKIK